MFKQHKRRRKKANMEKHYSNPQYFVRKATVFSLSTLVFVTNYLTHASPQVKYFFFF